MQPLARKALDCLWRRADRAGLKGASRTISLRLSASSFPEYLSIPTREEKEVFHAEMREASRRGAISVRWDKRAGEDGQILGITLLSLDALGTLLGHRTTGSKILAAQAALSKWSNHPNVAALIAAWMAGRSPRGVRVDCANDAVDAMRLIEECAAGHRRDVSERRISAQLFGDSKRIERMSTAIDLMTASSFDEAEPRTQLAVLAELGLLKHPQPMLVSGVLELVLGRNPSDARVLQAPFPYIGIAPQHVYSVRGTPSYVLSVENLTIFHELANEGAGPITGVLLYTGGYPTPTMLKAYRLMLQTFGVPVWHWGDTDLGGFRIANVLANAAMEVGRSVRPWQMAAYAEGHRQRSLSVSEIAAIGRICERWGWSEHAAAVSAVGTIIEQELQPLALPG